MQPTQSQIRNRNKKRAEEKKRQEEARRKEASRPRPGSYQDRAGGQSKPPKKEDNIQGIFQGSEDSSKCQTHYRFNMRRENCRNRRSFDEENSLYG